MTIACLVTRRCQPNCIIHRRASVGVVSAQVDIKVCISRTCCRCCNALLHSKCCAMMTMMTISGVVSVSSARC